MTSRQAHAVSDLLRLSREALGQGSQTHPSGPRFADLVEALTLNLGVAVRKARLPPDEAREVTRDWNRAVSAHRSGIIVPNLAEATKPKAAATPVWHVATVESTVGLTRHWWESPPMDVEVTVLLTLLRETETIHAVLTTLGMPVPVVAMATRLSVGQHLAELGTSDALEWFAKAAVTYRATLAAASTLSPGAATWAEVLKEAPLDQDGDGETEANAETRAQAYYIQQRLTGLVQRAEAVVDAALTGANEEVTELIRERVGGVGAEYFGWVRNNLPVQPEDIIRGLQRGRPLSRAQEAAIAAAMARAPESQYPFDGSIPASTPLQVLRGVGGAHDDPDEDFAYHDVLKRIVLCPSTDMRVSMLQSKLVPDEKRPDLHYAVEAMKGNA